MKKGKIRSELSLQKVKSDVQEKEEISVPLDVLVVKILSLKIPDDVPGKFAVEVTFFDQTVINGVINSVGVRESIKKHCIARGKMSYDPSDYEKMCNFADHPLLVSIHPIESPVTNKSIDNNSIDEAYPLINMQSPNTSCCNIDILTLFIDQEKLKIVKRMQPVRTPSVLARKSWNNLPEISLELRVIRNNANSVHHKVLSNANVMKITLIGAYNMFDPFEDESIYTAASKMPINICDESNSSLITFNNGYKLSRKFNSTTSFYPKWESQRVKDVFTKCDEKFVCQMEEFTNNDHINTEYYLNAQPDCCTNDTTLWKSFHRGLMLKDSEKWFSKYIRSYKWPFEIQVYGEYGTYNLMAFLDLFKLLYPGENAIRLITPLQWINSESMMINCNCDTLLFSTDKTSSAQGTVKKPSKATTDSAPTSISTELGLMTRPTGGDNTSAFIIIEIKLTKPLINPVIPPHISMQEMDEMLKQMEELQFKRQCTARGQLKSEWQSTIQCAANSLRRIPYYGMSDICAINRQLSETRNRVEIITSFWQDAATYINNHFIPQEFLANHDLYEEMLMMAHVCLMRTAYDVLVGVDNQNDVDSTLRAARQARQLKDVRHATDLFLQLIAERPRDHNMWRELATSLKEVDKDWANVCINKSLTINLRHPLTLLSKACMVFEEDPDAAEPFFSALLSLYPFWVPMWVAANAYYLHRQMYEMAQEIMECIVKTTADGLEEENKFPRTWEDELGDWWDHTPLLPGTSLYYEAADLLIRIRAITLAEVCVAWALYQSGDSAVHYHLLALCCRLRNDPTSALCHLEQGISKFGDISYLRSLEGECHHKLKNIPAAAESFEKAGTCSSAYSILLSLSRRDPKRMRSLLVDLIRRQPSAYAWMALADNWMTQSTNSDGSNDQSSALAFASACAVQALKWDRCAGRAWALLAKLVKPNARRLYCKTMAITSGYNRWSEVQLQQSAGSRQSLCYRLGTVIRDCQCNMCIHLAL